MIVPIKGITILEYFQNLYISRFCNIILNVNVFAGRIGDGLFDC